jgi:hypothetical protein
MRRVGELSTQGLAKAGRLFGRILLKAILAMPVEKVGRTLAAKILKAKSILSVFLSLAHFD